MISSRLRNGPRRPCFSSAPAPFASAPPKDAGSAIVEVLDLDLTALQRGEGGGMSQAVEFSWRSLLDRGRRSELCAVPPPLLNPASAGVGLLVG